MSEVPLKKMNIFMVSIGREELTKQVLKAVYCLVISDRLQKQSYVTPEHGSGLNLLK
jgi:hypothetical protein